MHTHRQTDRETHAMHADSRHCHPSSCSESAVDEKQKNAVLCTLYVVYAMYTACYTVHIYYTVPCTLYCIAANFGLVQIFIYFILNLIV